MIVRSPRRRSAAAVIETAFVMIPTLIFFFGVFEYGRWLMDRQVVNNAAREGCRWALANNTSGTNTAVQATVLSKVNSYMSGRQPDFLEGSSGSLTSTSVTCTGTQSSTGNTVTDVTTLQAGDFIAVKLSLTFKFLNIVPLVPLPTTVPMNTTCTMLVEGGV